MAAVALAVLRYSSQARGEDGGRGFRGSWLLIEVLAAIAIVVAAVSGHRAAL
jgi:hypothetical protein